MSTHNRDLSRQKFLSASELVSDISASRKKMKRHIPGGAIPAGVLAAWLIALIVAYFLR